MEHPTSLRSFLLIITVALLPSLYEAREMSSLVLKKKILDNLFAGYDPRLRPNGTDGSGPVEVRVNTYVRWIDSVDVADMSYTAQLTFRQQWKDSRLSYGDTYGNIPYINLKDPSMLWTPDTFFSNEKDGHYHNLLTPNCLIRVFPDGEVLYSVRVSLKMACPMDLRNFPMDTQTCSLILASYGYTTADIRYAWKEYTPVQLSKTLEVPQYNIGKFYTGLCTSRTNTGEYSCLRADFQLKREFHTYLSQLYIPSFVLVAVSWLGFWLHVSTPSVRATLPLVGLFLLGCMSLRSRAVLNISYTTSLDVWIDTCAIFLLLALVEYSVAHWLAGRTGTTSRGPGDLENGKGSDSKAEPNKDQSRLLEQSFMWIKSRNPSERIDVASRILFPVAFFIFNIYYWATYPVQD